MPGLLAGWLHVERRWSSVQHVMEKVAQCLRQSILTEIWGGESRHYFIMPLTLELQVPRSQSIMPGMGWWSSNHKRWVSKTGVQIKGSATPYHNWIFPSPTYTRGEANPSLICKAKISGTKNWKSFTDAWVLQPEVWPFEIPVYCAQMQKARRQEMQFKRPSECAGQVIDLVAAYPCFSFLGLS